MAVGVAIHANRDSAVRIARGWGSCVDDASRDSGSVSSRSIPVVSGSTAPVVLPGGKILTHEFPNPTPEMGPRLMSPGLPVVHAHGVNPEEQGDVRLPEPKVKPPLPDCVPDRANLPRIRRIKGFRGSQRHPARGRHEGVGASMWPA